MMCWIMIKNGKWWIKNIYEKKIKLYSYAHVQIIIRYDYVILKTFEIFFFQMKMLVKTFVM
jgi:hypothetical protein